MDTKAILARVTADLEVATAELQVAQEKVDRLRVIFDGLQLAVEEYETPPTAQQTTAQTQEDTAENSGRRDEELHRSSLPGVPDRSAKGEAVSQVDLAIAALTALRRPASTHEVQEKIAAAGYDRSHDQVRGALTWLLKTRRVERVAPGTWTLPKTTPQNEPVPLTGGGGAGLRNAATLNGAGSVSYASRR
jgi:hypothetical protein